MFHGSAVTSVMAGSDLILQKNVLDFNDAQVKPGWFIVAKQDKSYAAIDPFTMTRENMPLTMGALGLGMGYGEKNVFHFHQYDLLEDDPNPNKTGLIIEEVTNESRLASNGAALIAIAKRGHRIVNLSQGNFISRDSRIGRKLFNIPRGDKDGYEDVLSSISPFWSAIGEFARSRDMVVTVAAGNNINYVNVLALPLPFLVAGAIATTTGKMEANSDEASSENGEPPYGDFRMVTSISPNPSFIGAPASMYVSDGKVSKRWRGTSLSAPLVTSEIALIELAAEARTGKKPTAAELKSTLLCNSQSTTVPYYRYFNKLPALSPAIGLLNSGSPVQAALNGKLSKDLSCIGLPVEW